MLSASELNDMILHAIPMLFVTVGSLNRLRQHFPSRPDKK